MSRYCFLGDSFAANTLREAARRRGLTLVPLPEADLIFVSQDTKTDGTGKRDMSEVLCFLDQVKKTRKPIVLTSQVEPGFCRQYGHEHDISYRLYHQAETLRIEDGLQRGMFPEQIIIGSICPAVKEYQEYLDAFDCAVHWVTWEEAEFAKLAINYCLASQVRTTNELAERAGEVGADWGKIARILRHDHRIGKYAYLTPGRWEDSIHLLRDYVTLDKIRAFA